MQLGFGPFDHSTNPQSTLYLVVTNPSCWSSSREQTFSLSLSLSTILSPTRHQGLRETDPISTPFFFLLLVLHTLPAAVEGADIAFHFAHGPSSSNPLVLQLFHNFGIPVLVFAPHPHLKSLPAPSLTFLSLSLSFSLRSSPSLFLLSGNRFYFRADCLLTVPVFRVTFFRPWPQPSIVSCVFLLFFMLSIYLLLP